MTASSSMESRTAVAASSRPATISIHERLRSRLHPGIIRASSSASAGMSRRTSRIAISASSSRFESVVDRVEWSRPRAEVIARSAASNWP